MNHYQKGSSLGPSHNMNEGLYSIALDLGTTNLAALLLENGTGTIIAESKSDNPQILYGSDILTRMHRAMSGDAENVHKTLVHRINEMIRELSKNAGISNHDINVLSVAGNTAMTHFFLGLDVSTIPVAPFEPVVKKPGYFLASDISVDMRSGALVYVFPNAGELCRGRHYRRNRCFRNVCNG